MVTTTVTNFYMLDLAGSESFDYDDGLSGRGMDKSSGNPKVDKSDQKRKVENSESNSFECDFQ